MSTASASGAAERGDGWAVYHGAATAILPRLPARSVDMVYLDPPFGTGRLWTGKAGSFDDRWEWTADTAAAIARLREYDAGTLADSLGTVPLSRDDLAYLAAMAELLVACRGCLKLTGTLWLHCDDTFGAYLRLIGDLLFLGRGEVVWKRTNSHNGTTRGFGRVHDNIFVFARSRATDLKLARVRLAGRSDDEIVVAGDALRGPIHITGLVLNEQLNPTASERLNYPTQKPVALLRRLIALATLPGDTVLDPCCGSGTTVVAARQLGRRVVGIDQSADAVALTAKRLRPAQTDLFGFAA